MTTLDERPISRAVIYTRVSRDDSGEGQSNARQEEQCRKLADMRGCTVVAVEAHVSISAYSGKHRPAWQRVLRMAEMGEVDVIVAWRLDRVTRRVKELVDLTETARRTGVAVATTDGQLDLTTPTGKAVATILGAVAELEVEVKAQRQRLANAQRRASGERFKTAWRSFGYTDEGEIVEHEAALIRQAAEDVLNGTTLREIARRWRESGVSTPRSSKGAAGWTHQGVRSILLNPRNAGLQTYKGEIVGKGNWQPILTEDTHALLVATLTDPKRRTNPTPTARKPATLLSGIARCGVCGEKVQGGTRGRTVNGQQVRVPSYRCPNDHLATTRQDADGRVKYLVASAVAFNKPGALLPLAGPSTDDLMGRRQTLTERLAGAALTDAAGSITDDQLATIIATPREELDQIDAEIARAAPADAEDIHINQVEDMLQSDNVTDLRKVLAYLGVEVLLRPN